VTIDLDRLGGPFDTVFDVGGNVGDFAQAAVEAWPQAKVVSFEPIPWLADESRRKADVRWQVIQVAISRQVGTAILNVCVNQNSASTLQQPGKIREQLGIIDVWEPLEVNIEPLDFHLGDEPGRLLLKVDVEGHEADVFAGASRVLAAAATVVVEVQNDPNIFLGSPSPGDIHAVLSDAGFQWVGVVDSFTVLDIGRGRVEVLQFDGLWRRES
jgi:FkbM family methyltransferase